MATSAQSLEKEKSDQITLLVIKKNFASRAFEVPLKWISSLGLFLGLGLVGLFAAIFLAVKFYRTAERSDPSRTLDLEKRLAASQAAYKKLEYDFENLKTTTVAPETPQVTEEAETEPTAEVGKPSGAPVLFSDLPPSFRMRDRNALPPPIRVSGTQAFWKGNRLQVRFNILYTSKDGGNQQGRIVVISKGPETLLGYPRGVMNAENPAHLIDPGKGEYFSVSRFRRGEAEFGPLSRSQRLKQADVLLFSQEGELIIQQKIRIPGRPQARAKPRPEPTPPAPVETESSTEESIPRPPPTPEGGGGR